MQVVRAFEAQLVAIRLELRGYQVVCLSELIVLLSAFCVSFCTFVLVKQVKLYTFLCVLLHIAHRHVRLSCTFVRVKTSNASKLSICLSALCTSPTDSVLLYQ